MTGVQTCALPIYKRREINVGKNPNQMVTILLKEERNILDEVIVLPGENEALPILRRVIESRDKNNPDKFMNLSTLENQKTKLFFINIKQRALQRKIFRDMQKGTIRTSDSLLIIPVYHETKTEELTTNSEQQTERKTIRKDEKSLQIIPENQLAILLENYTPQINFYKNQDRKSVV